jgi:hypothetical protein
MHHLPALEWLRYHVEMSPKLKEVLQRAQTWPERAQEELAEIALEIEAGLAEDYRATPDELEAIDEADRSGVASEADVEAAFRTFRRS